MAATDDSQDHSSLRHLDRKAGQAGERERPTRFQLPLADTESC